MDRLELHEKLSWVVEAVGTLAEELLDEDYEGVRESIAATIIVLYELADEVEFL